MPLKGLKKCGIETQNSLVFSEHSFAASNATDHDVGDKNENNCENQQTLVLETQHVNPPEEPELMANADYDPPKKPVSVFFLFQTIALFHYIVEKKEKTKK
ncbi:uncharacterized protein TNCV_3906251 [Trichonephila clavipes]|nr:uncharacterized protein TNCV_3906251 [Trichonephila clavipes]